MLLPWLLVYKSVYSSRSCSWSSDNDSAGFNYGNGVCIGSSDNDSASF